MHIFAHIYLYTHTYVHTVGLATHAMAKFDGSWQLPNIDASLFALVAVKPPGRNSQKSICNLNSVYNL